MTLDDQPSHSSPPCPLLPSTSRPRSSQSRRIRIRLFSLPLRPTFSPPLRHARNLHAKNFPPLSRCIGMEEAALQLTIPPLLRRLIAPRHEGFRMSLLDGEPTPFGFPPQLAAERVKPPHPLGGDRSRKPHGLHRDTPYGGSPQQ